MSAVTRSMPRIARAWLLAAVAWAACGCGGPPTATVRGTVTLAGRPVSGGSVLFEGEGRVFGGAIGPDGTYELRDRGRPYIVPGTFTVAIVPPEPTFVVDERTTQMRLSAGTRPAPIPGNTATP